MATAQFDDRARELRFVSNYSSRPRACQLSLETDITDFDRPAPFAYAPYGRSARPRALHRAAVAASCDRSLERGVLPRRRLCRHPRTARRHDANHRRTFKHVSRHEKGIQPPVCTLNLGSGSCRDLAVFMIAALRARGIAARFVSGYLYLADDDDDDCAPAATPTPGSRSTFPVRAGSISIRREASSAMKNSSASRSPSPARGHTSARRMVGDHSGFPWP